MTVYNTRPYVAQAPASIHRQSYQNWELLVWDDGSSDGSDQVIAEWVRRNARIRVVGGSYRNRRGVAKTTMWS